MHLANGNIWSWILILFIVISGVIIFSFFIKNKLINDLFSKGQKSLILSNMNYPIRLLKISALIIALFFICFAVLDPRWGTKSVQANIEGIDVVFILDISKSMTTPDVVPNRLEVSKKLSSQLMSLLLGNRIGITAFAGFAFNVIPLTEDINASAVFLNELSPDMIDVQGTNLEDAIKKAMELFEKETLTHKAIVIFTDGEDYEFSPMNQVKIAKEKGISIFTVGIGTPNGGQIPLYDSKGNLQDYLQKDGKIVVSRLNEELLTKISEETKGFYINGNENSIITLANRLDEIKKSRFGSNAYEFMEPQFQYFLLIGLLFLFISVFLPDRNIRINPWLKQFILILVLIIPLQNKSFPSDASAGTREYRKGNFEGALTNFQKSIVSDPKNEKYRFNEGDSYYRLQKFDEAASSFLNLTNSKDKTVRDKAIYNYGNSMLEKQDYSGAINAYRSILGDGQKDGAIYKKTLQNFLYAKEKIREQKQNNQNDKNNKNDRNKNKDKDKNNDNKNNQNEQNNKDNKSRDKNQQQSKPISPNDIENLLNLIQEEEKKHLSKKEMEKGVRISPRYEW